MHNLNSILLEGNLARDPELRCSPSDGTPSGGTPQCTLVVATARTYRLDGERREEVSFIEGVTHGKLATMCAEHLQKGRGVRLVGRLKQERWEDAEGNSRSKVVIVCEHVEFQHGRRAPAPQADTADVAS
jgi:single-strand DNA-binding protein